MCKFQTKCKRLHRLTHPLFTQYLQLNFKKS
nr:MAG TPA: hypothetical protein [Caudoviricetes sp.]